MPFLGNEMFNTDVWKWKQRIYDFGSGVFNIDFDKTLQKYHPGVSLMWTGSIAIKFQGLYCAVIPCPDETTDMIGAVFTLHFFQKLTVVVVMGLTFAFIFYPLRKMFGKKYAVITLGLLSFEPFFYALSRVIHLEGLMTSFMLAGFVWLLYYLEGLREGQDKKVKIPLRLILSAIFSGLAILTKSSAVFMIPFFILTVVIFHRRDFKKVLRISVIWSAILLITYFILWPSMWVHPIQTLDYVFIRGVKEVGVEGGHEQIFLGKYTEDPGPVYYLVVMALKFSPVLLAGLILVTVFYKKINQHFDQGKIKRFAFMAGIFTLGYMLEITIPAKKLDRYILPSLASFSLLAGFFYTWFFFTVLPKTYRYIATGVFFIVLIFQSLSLTPDYFSYYNPVTGGLSKGIYTLEPKWIIGQHQVADYFYELKQREGLEAFEPGESLDNQRDLSKKLTVAFPEKYYTQIWPFIRKTGGWATIEDLSGDAKRTKYFVYPVWDDYSGEETRFKLTYMDSVYLRGVKLYNVYLRHDY